MTTDGFILGLDIGTSAVKAVLVDLAQTVRASASVQLTTSRLWPGWSEQRPEDWIEAARVALAQLRTQAAADFSGVRAIGLSGQMHGAVVLDANGTPLRPAILWNDGRAEAECAGLLAAMPALPMVAGVPPMPGLTAPKLLWLRRHCPGVRFVWIMGADNLRGFHRWWRWRDIARLLPIAIVDRPQATLNVAGSRVAQALARYRIDESGAALLAGRRAPAFMILHGPRSALSSTQLRAAGQKLTSPRS